MRDRIKAFMDFKGLNAGELAGMLDVQPSNISHILHGRNKPSAAFIEKFLQVFPEINARWLLTGSGEITESQPGNRMENQDDSSSPSSKNVTEVPVVEGIKKDKEVQSGAEKDQPLSLWEEKPMTSAAPHDDKKNSGLSADVSGTREEPPVTYGGKQVGLSDSIQSERSSENAKTGVSGIPPQMAGKASVSRVILLFDDGTFVSYDPARP